MGLGKKIRQLREELGMSQAQLATSAELSQGYLSQLENGEVHHPSAAVIFRLSKAVHADPRLFMKAAGYQGDEDIPSESVLDVTVDPDLLRFLARFPRDEQGHLLRLFKALEVRDTPKTSRAPLKLSPNSLPANRAMSKAARGS